MPYIGKEPNPSPTQTLGTGAAEDILLKLDGNAVDYHIGIDDSVDLLTIGKGSALGTTTSMSFDGDGIMNMPLQPAYSGHLSGHQTLATGTWTKLALATELYDKNNDFDSSTNYRFTVPVDGIYVTQLNASFGLTAGNDCGVAVHLNGSERIRRVDVPGRNGGHFGVNCIGLFDLDATDYLEFYAFHTEGSDDTVTGSKEYSYVMVHKIA